MSKYDRQGAILRLVQERRLGTQEEVVAARDGLTGAQLAEELTHHLEGDT